MQARRLAVADTGAPPTRRHVAALHARLGAWRQWPRETRDTLFQLILIAWIVMPHLSHLPGWSGALTALVLLWRAQLALTGGPLPSRWKVMALWPSPWA